MSDNRAPSDPEGPSIEARVYFPLAHTQLGQMESVVATAVRRFNPSTNFAWVDAQGFAEKIETQLCRIGSELARVFDGKLLTEEKFYEKLANSRYQAENGSIRTYLQDVQALLFDLEERYALHFTPFDLYWVWIFVEEYAESYLKLGKDFDLDAFSAERAELLGFSPFTRSHRPDIAFLKASFLEYHVGSKRGEVELALLRRAKAGNLKAIELFRQGFNARRSITRKESLSVHLDASSPAALKPSSMGEEELKARVAALRKKVGEVSPSPSCSDNLPESPHESDD